MNTVVLASASPRRRRLFKMMGIDCSVDPSDTVEIIDDSIKPEENVCRLAEQKALDVVDRHSNGIIIAADTIVVRDGEILGKPSTKDDAFRMLRSLSGRHHHVFSGVTIMDAGSTQPGDDAVSFYEKTKVTFSTLDDTEIKSYIATGSPMDKAGAYGIQDDYGSIFICKIEGDYYNVVGFPVNKFYQTLKQKHPAMFKRVFGI